MVVAVPREVEKWWHLLGCPELDLPVKKQKSGNVVRCGGGWSQRNESSIFCAVVENKPCAGSAIPVQPGWCWMTGTQLWWLSGTRDCLSRGFWRTAAESRWILSLRRCDADPSALANYVVALVKKDKPEKELKAFCADQLDVFLQKGTFSTTPPLQWCSYHAEGEAGG